MLRTMGYQNPNIDPPHPWYKVEKWVFTPWKCDSAPMKDTIAVLDIKATAETSWVVDCAGGDQDLAEIIKKYSLKKIMFKLQTPEPPAGKSLSQYVEQIPNHKDLEIGVWATVAAVGRDLRKLRPDWLFALDSATVLQFQTLSKMFIEPLASLWADFWIEDTKLSAAFRLTGRSREEVVRRNKKIIAVDDGSISELPSDTKGILTTRPSYWLSRPR